MRLPTEAFGTVTRLKVKSPPSWAVGPDCALLDVAICTAKTKLAVIPAGRPMNIHSTLIPVAEISQNLAPQTSLIAAHCQLTGNSDVNFPPLALLCQRGLALLVFNFRVLCVFFMFSQLARKLYERRPTLAQIGGPYGGIPRRGRDRL